MLDDIFIAGAVDETGEAEGIESEDDDGGSGIGIEAEAREVDGATIGNGSFFNAIDDEVREDLALLRWKVEIGFDTGEGDADGFGRRKTEIEL